ncbi:hypothetical protein DFH94DRAFT_685109 [Russula ochroleuca]|uniref:Uncharacterized protein n=1 Tax=Russula ochroleuca TaxID=152965 RepID=A0A9P5JYE9_9AGAM|nr:hypothetical protein DFH94DRAFT_685109 [Russula ochroleuca]
MCAIFLIPTSPPPDVSDMVMNAGASLPYQWQMGPWAREQSNKFLGTVAAGHGGVIAAHRRCDHTVPEYVRECVKQDRRACNKSTGTFPRRITSGAHINFIGKMFRTNWQVVNGQFGAVVAAELVGHVGILRCCNPMRSWAEFLCATDVSHVRSPVSQLSNFLPDVAGLDDRDRQTFVKEFWSFLCKLASLLKAGRREPTLTRRVRAAATTSNNTSAIPQDRLFRTAKEEKEGRPRVIVIGV